MKRSSRAGVEQRQAPAFGIVLGGDDDLDFAGELADGLGEFRLFIGEDLDLLFLRCSSVPPSPTTIRWWRCRAGR